MRSAKKLLYFADPMCSWCWGFSPLIDRIRTDYPVLDIELIVGGLRAGFKDPLGTAMREEILHHWRQVARTTGQTFTFENALPVEFVYDTEPACRAVVAVRRIQPDAGLDFLAAVHRAFYVDLRDVRQTAILQDIAAVHVDGDEFADCYTDELTRLQTRHDFEKTRGFGIRGFPSLVVHDERGYVKLSQGYRPLAHLQPLLNAWLEKVPKQTN